MTEDSWQVAWSHLAPGVKHLTVWLSAVYARPLAWADLATHSFLAPLRLLLEAAPPELGLPRPDVGDEAAEVRRYHVTARHVAQQVALASLLGELARADVPVIVLKGAYLAALLYPADGLRKTFDVDLLVRRQHLPAAHGVLNQLGYTCRRPDSVLLAQARNGPFAYGQASYVHPDQPRVVFDLHWHWVSTYVSRAATRVDMDGIWTRATAVRSPSGSLQPGREWSALTMAAEDTLVHLGYHLVVHHRLGDLRGFLDIDQFLRRFGLDLDWTALGQRAVDYRVGNAVFFALWFSRELLGTPVPATVLETLRPPRWHPSWLAARRLAPENRLNGGVTGALFGPAWELFMADRLPDLLRAGWTMVFPDPAILRARDGLPESAGALELYLARFKRRVRRTGR